MTDAGHPGGAPDPPSSDWVDVSRPLSPVIPVWPGDRRFEMRQVEDRGMVVSSIATTCHVGTHLDAPLHLDSRAGGVESVPLGRLIGRAEILHARPEGRLVGRTVIPNQWRPSFRRLLVRTDSHPLNAPIAEGFAGLDPGFIGWLADHGVELVGIDTPSVDPFDSEELPAHRELLRRGMTWLEGLYLESTGAGSYQMVALPMALHGADAAPTRVVVRRVAAQEGGP